MPPQRVIRFDSHAAGSRGESGATAVEYALMAALIAVVIVVAVTALGVNLDALFRDPDLSNALTN